LTHVSASPQSKGEAIQLIDAKGLANVKKEISGGLQGWASQLRFTFKILKRDRAGLVGLVILLLFALMAIIGPEICPLEMMPHPEDRFLPPSLEHPLGTDFAGRDTLVQIIHGSRSVMTVAFLAGFFVVLISIVLGISSGYIGGKFDTLMMRIIDVFLTIPSFPLLVIIAASLNRTLSPVEVALIIAVVEWAGLTRAIRSQVLSIREENYIESARCLGLGAFHIIFNEIFPSLKPYIAMNLCLTIVSAIYSQVGLYFLGIMPYTSVNWGAMLNIALYRQSGLLNTKVWPYLFSPVICVILVQTSFILFLHTLEEIFNPRLRSEAA